MTFPCIILTDAASKIRNTTLVLKSPRFRWKKDATNIKSHFDMKPPSFINHRGVHSSSSSNKRSHKFNISSSPSSSSVHKSNKCHVGGHNITKNILKYPRCFSSTSSGGDGGNNSTVLAFDRNVKRLQRDGSARAHHKWKERNNNNDDDGDVDYDYFRTEIANRLVDRLDDIKREGGFPLALDIGSGAGYLHRAICADDGLDGFGGIGGIRKLVQVDMSEGMLHRDDDVEVEGAAERCGTYKLCAKEEGKLPFPDGTFDLVMSSGAMHWVNDLPMLLNEAKRVLKPDGCLMFAMVGGSTLSELRSSLVLAEMERDGGVSTHVGPFVDFSDVGSLLGAAGFTLPTVDIDTIHLAFPDACVLMEHLQRMGESNACLNRRDRVGVDTFISAAAIYQEMFSLDANEYGEKEEDGSIETTVQVIYAIGWTPHESQPMPLERGSATKNMGDI